MVPSHARAYLIRGREEALAYHVPCKRKTVSKYRYSYITQEYVQGMLSSSFSYFD